MSQTLFVSGASGQLGRAVVERLLEGGARVVAGTRSPEKLADLAERGVEVRRVDFNDAASLDAAFNGVDRALLISTDAVGARGPAQAAAVQAAKGAGVEHLVYTSFVNADVPGMALAEEHLATEEVIRDTYDSYTILRNNLYAEMALGGLEAALATGQLFSAKQDGKVSWVSRQDCARAAAAALNDAFVGTRTLDVAGPEALSGDDVAAIFSRVTGKPIQHVSIPAEALRQGMVDNGMPPMFAELFVSFDVSTADGLLEKTDSDFVALTGESGMRLEQVVRETLASAPNS